jgi:hypothetical protein
MTDQLTKLRTQVNHALGRVTAAERQARDSGREGDAILNAARADAYDWVLQRLDELDTEPRANTQIPLEDVEIPRRWVWLVTDPHGGAVRSFADRDRAYKLARNTGCWVTRLPTHTLDLEEAR